MTKASLSHYLLSLWINVPGASINSWATFHAGQTPTNSELCWCKTSCQKEEVEREERKQCLFVFRYAVGFVPV